MTRKSTPMSVLSRALYVMLGALSVMMLQLLRGAGALHGPVVQQKIVSSHSGGGEAVPTEDVPATEIQPLYQPDLWHREWKYQAGEAAGCPDSPVGLQVFDVAFGILTSERFVATRLRSQQLTWMTQVRDVVFYSESELAALPTVKLVPPRGEQLVGGGAWKNFPALMDLYRRFPHHKWVFFSDDDTFIFVKTLLRRLGNYNPNRDFYIGLYWTPRVDMEWREVQIAYASGGAGYALSRSLLQRMAGIMDSCHGNYTRWAGDIRVGKCVADLGVMITPEVGFHHERHDVYTWDSSGGGFPYGHLSNRASATISSPVTFHHLTVDHMNLYYRMQMADERGPHGELYRYDFGPLLFKQYVAESRALRYQFRVLLGISVEVSSDSSAVKEPVWRKDFADPLYVRRVRFDETGQPIFHMVIAKAPEIFNGDGCSANVDDPYRVPLRKATVLVLQCTPCVPLGKPDEAPGLGHICQVWKDDSCTLKISMAIECPKRLEVFAQHLDVGSRPGASDVVHMGVRTACVRTEPAAGSDGEGRALLSRPAQPAQQPSPTRSFFLSLRHSEIRLSVPYVHAETEGCEASLEGTGVAALGGLLRSAAGSQELPIRCSCARADPALHGGSSSLLVKVKVTIRLLDYSSASFDYMHACPTGEHELRRLPREHDRALLFA